MDSINLGREKMSPNSETNVAGSEVKDQFQSPLNSKHVCLFFFFLVHSTRNSYILDSNFLRVAVFYQNIKQTNPKSTLKSICMS